jgi:hypothetical protein
MTNQEKSTLELVINNLTEERRRLLNASKTPSGNFSKSEQTMAFRGTAHVIGNELVQLTGLWNGELGEK